MLKERDVLERAQVRVIRGVLHVDVQGQPTSTSTSTRLESASVGRLQLNFALLV